VQAYILPLLTAMFFGEAVEKKEKNRRKRKAKNAVETLETGAEAVAK